MMTTSVPKRTLTRRLMTLLLGGWLAACGSSPPAPVTEAGRPLQRSSPVIVGGGSIGAPPRADVRPSTPRSRVGDGAAGIPGTHVVQRGETLFSIAFQYDLDFRQLAIANGLNPPYTIFVDQELNLDVSRVVNAGRGSTTDIGTPVSDNGVARSQAGAAPSGVIRQPIDSVQGEPVWQWPLAGDILRRFTGTGSEGLDIGARAGDPVRAAAGGDVVYAGNGIQGAGNLVILRHNDRYLSAYGNNRTLLVAVGDHVEAGQQIAEVGENAAGVPLLHFEIRREGKAVDPAGLLPDG